MKSELLLKDFSSHQGKRVTGVSKHTVKVLLDKGKYWRGVVIFEKGRV